MKAETWLSNDRSSPRTASSAAVSPELNILALLKTATLARCVRANEVQLQRDEELRKKAPIDRRIRCASYIERHPGKECEGGSWGREGSVATTFSGEVQSRAVAMAADAAGAQITSKPERRLLFSPGLRSFTSGRRVDSRRRRGPVPGRVLLPSCHYRLVQSTLE